VVGARIRHVDTGQREHRRQGYDCSHQSCHAIGLRTEYSGQDGHGDDGEQSYNTNAECELGCSGNQATGKGHDVRLNQQTAEIYQRIGPDFLEIGRQPFVPFIVLFEHHVVG